MKLGVLFTSAVVAACAFAADISSPLLVAGSGRAALVDQKGNIAWEKKGCGNIHRVWLRGNHVYYSNGDLRRIDLVTDEDSLVYRPAPKEGVWGFEVLANGNLVVAVNATDEIVELQAETLKEIVRFKVDPRSAKGETPNPHNHLRMIRKTAAGTYLVCCSVGRMVREYDAAGKLLWEQETPALAFDCLRLKNGNTLISHLGAISEYTPDHKVAWSFACSEAPELKLANLCGLQEMPNGNFVVGTYANGKPDRSQTTAFEITRAKKIVWAYNAPDRSMMTAFRVEAHRWPIGFCVPTAEESAKMESAVAAWTAAAAKPVAPRRVLVVSRAFGYSHHEALAFGQKAFKFAGEKSGAFAADLTADVSVLADSAKLAKYDAVVLNNTTFIKTKTFPGMREALTGFVEGGKGLVLVHSAVDAFYDDEAVQKMNGGLFCGHPWMAGGTWRYKNERPGDSVNAAFAKFGEGFAFSDEIYMQKTPPFSRADCEVLVSLDMADPATKAAADRWGANPKLKHMPLRADGDYAVAWTKSYGKGRVFYTSFGHDRRAFLDERFGHMLCGLQWAIGDLRR